MLKVYYTHLSDKKVFIENQLLSLISKERLEKINRYKFEDDKRRSLIAGALLRYAIIQNYNVIESDIVFNTNKYGKPFLSNYPFIFFNLSHSEDIVICAISDKNVGIDVEKNQEVNISVIKNFFHPKEYISINETSKENQLSLFYQYWTAKESFVKYLGKGLSFPLKDFCLSIEKNKIHLEINNFDSTKVFFSNLCIEPQYTTTLCHEEKAVDSCVSISLNDLLIATNDNDNDNSK